ncbi:uncharacterized protein LOC113025676 isoform X3 [Astatotilapia calliptera]|uniref:uncharacterized protein LOC113006445 isoform X2 n=1 Tax=Astatotilapia calliptera TaxID=8154 RepID=UPI000E428D24|nr:uncharacterized protein LOC113006445 isoform X2 [Astatotilapia calliptera]XP_026024968.1 uncharacterized protein LOC113023090 isoform X2 [Astatotilapia calliptera]XP_026025559.1 uncharacterized protein LOC113023551 isoform X2 [Astatotilapia calliptera]XP_026029480.1 uncharacterized protein LOC113025676 isoform X3 [Astatotilapia calliptera]
MFALTCVCFPICISKRTARQPRGGGRGPLMTPQQEERICAMVAANNALRLREIQRTVVNDDTIFGNIQSISISTIDRVLRRNEMSMKQLYRVPFERNSDRVKELRHQYVQHILELEAREPLHMFVYLDEAGFNLAKGRRRGRNHIGERATIDVPGQRGGNITMCAAISENGVHTHIPRIGAYNSQHLLAFLDALHRDLIPQNGRDDPGDNRTIPFLNPIEEFFSSWRWKVYDRHPHTQMTLLAAMDAACDDITAESCRGWIRHSRRYFPRCIDRADIRCDVDANMWADRRERLDIND